MKRFLLSPRFLLPVGILISLTVVSLRAAEIWDTVSSGKLLVHPAQAEEKAADKPAQAKADAPAPAATPEAKAKEDDSKTNLTQPPTADATPAEMDVLKQLADRREQLEKRSRDLDMRESLMKVAEQRIEQKIKEMETLRAQLQSMVNQAGEAQQVQLDNLVKIYETMKPEEAAKIFEGLDMKVLLGVIQRMKPARTAPILAKMAPDKAKDITVALTKQDQLPQVK